MAAQEEATPTVGAGFERAGVSRDLGEGEKTRAGRGGNGGGEAGAEKLSYVH